MVSWSCVEISCCVPNCTAPSFHPSLSPEQATSFESSIVSKCKVPSAFKSELFSHCCVRTHKHFLYSITLPISSPEAQTLSNQKSTKIPNQPAQQSTIMSKEIKMETMSSHFTGFIADNSTPAATPQIMSPITSPILSPRSPSATTPTRLRSLSKLQIPQQRLLQPQQLSQPPSPLQLRPQSANKDTPKSAHPKTGTSAPDSLSPSPFHLLTQHLLKVPQLSQQVSPLSTTYMPRSGSSISPMSGRGSPRGIGSPRSTMGIAGTPYSGRSPFSARTMGSMGGSPLALSNLSSPILGAC
jgi:hypothetical protein